MEEVRDFVSEEGGALTCETVPPQALRDLTQQTPKPAAQFPSAEAPEPDLAAHSVAVMHVPFSVGSVDGVHVSCCKFSQMLFFVAGYTVILSTRGH